MNWNFAQMVYNRYGQSISPVRIFCRQTLHLALKFEFVISSKTVWLQLRLLIHSSAITNGITIMLLLEWRNPSHRWMEKSERPNWLLWKSGFKLVCDNYNFIKTGSYCKSQVTMSYQKSATKYNQPLNLNSCIGRVRLGICDTWHLSTSLARKMIFIRLIGLVNNKKNLLCGLGFFYI